MRARCSPATDPQANDGARTTSTRELFRRNDDIPLQLALTHAVSDAARLVAALEIGEVTAVVERLTSIAAQAITFRRKDWVDRAVRALNEVYRLGFDRRGYQRPDVAATTLWLVVVEHVLALGALAVRQENWDAVRSLATTAPGDADGFYASWLRHGLTMASRANMLDESKSLITLAAERVAATPALHPDVPADDDRVITSVCQFDLLAALAIIGLTGDARTSGWYTNFARFESPRSEPAVQRLLANADMRATLFPGTDADLATALREVDRMATNEGARYWGWTGFGSATVDAFLAANPPPVSEPIAT